MVLAHLVQSKHRRPDSVAHNDTKGVHNARAVTPCRNRQAAFMIRIPKWCKAHNFAVVVQSAHYMLLIHEYMLHMKVLTM